MNSLSHDDFPPEDPPSNSDLDRLALESDARMGENSLQAIHQFLGRFVSYPSEHARVAHTLWIAHAHMMDLWDSTPRIAFLSAEPASGKTRALEITELLVPNAVAAVNVSPAYLFRKVASDGSATILYDEIDTVFGPKAKENEDIRGLLNAGHRRGATAGRCVMRGNEPTLEELPAYAAVALAGLGWLPHTILSRSVIVRMRRRHAGERIEPFRRRLHEAEGWNVRDRVAVWAASLSEIGHWPELPPEIVDRDADVWEPLIAVADLAGGTWPERARTAAVFLVASAKEVEPSLGIRLLSDLKEVFGDTVDMTSRAVLDALLQIEEAPWPDLKGKPLDDRSLAHRLRQYGVKPRTLRRGTTTPRGYVRADFIDVWARYLAAGALPTPATSKTTETSETRANALEPDTTQAASDLVSDVLDVSVDAGGGRPKCAHCGGQTGEILSASVDGHSFLLHRECIKQFRSQ